LARYRRGDAVMGLESTRTRWADDVAGALSMGFSNMR
jgi:hypothetical protein